MIKTHVRPVRDLRNNFAELDNIVNNRDHVIITNNGRGTAALIGIEEYAVYEKVMQGLLGKYLPGITALPKDWTDIVLAGMAKNAPSPKPKMSRAESFGCMRGQFIMSDDFDAPLDDFKEYM
ncbi:MAG: type II toxin-antitoxin system prevent-host-death family antitoxin [Defluviitaleaceae bacterium]|nr:type II toxin-antitoxin system prevent-host-death family antitoxin [Defluviitaleaceae bacterium]